MLADALSTAFYVMRPEEGGTEYCRGTPSSRPSSFAPPGAMTGPKVQTIGLGQGELLVFPAAAGAD